MTVLVGSAHLEAYDWAGAPPCLLWRGFGSRSRRRMLAKKVLDHDVTTAVSGTCVLFLNHGGNMHRFMAKEQGGYIPTARSLMSSRSRRPRTKGHAPITRTSNPPTSTAILATVLHRSLSTTMGLGLV